MRQDDIVMNVVTWHSHHWSVSPLWALRTLPRVEDEVSLHIWKQWEVPCWSQMLF